MSKISIQIGNLRDEKINNSKMEDVIAETSRMCALIIKQLGSNADYLEVIKVNFICGYYEDLSTIVFDIVLNFNGDKIHHPDAVKISYPFKKPEKSVREALFRISQYTEYFIRGKREFIKEITDAFDLNNFNKNSEQIWKEINR